MVQMQTMQQLVLQNLTTFFPRQESYCIFLDVGAHNRHSNDCVYVIMKVECGTRTPLNVDPGTVVPKAEILLQKWVHHLLCYHDKTNSETDVGCKYFSERHWEIVDPRESLNDTGVDAITKDMGV